MDLLISKDSDDINRYDLVFVNGECPTTENYTDVVRQRIIIRLRTFYSEWYLTERYGVPWLEKILGHKRAKPSADIIIQEQIRGVQGVSNVFDFKSSFDNPSREYKCSFRVKTDKGDLSDIITI